MSKARVFKIAIATLIVVLIVGVVYLVRPNYLNDQKDLNGQKEQNIPPSPWVPTFNVTLNVGDSWKLATIIDEKEYTLNITVTGEEKVDNVDCYVMALTFEPENPKAETGISNEMTSWLDKLTLNVVKLKGKGSARGYDFIYTEKHSYTFQGRETSITVGTEYNQTDTKTTNVDVDLGLGAWIKGYMHQESTTTNCIKVEAVEDITVPAGIFTCYKIVTYDETGQSLISIRWFSMEAKNVVKNENYTMNEKSELLSYSTQ